MKSSAIFLLLIVVLMVHPVSLSATVYYISPSGSDTNSGTITSPWFTMQKAWLNMVAGDLLYLRGGTYNYTTKQSLTTKDGSSSDTLKIFNYPGESPVLDFSSSIGVSMAVVLKNADYVYLKGIRITGLSNGGMYGMILYDDVNHSRFERIETDHITGGWGVVIGDNCSDLLFLNCDSHHNQDPTATDPYGGSDGFETGSHGVGASTNITFRGCRAWSNSDDGWDLRQADGVFTIDNCWSFWNGFIPDTWNQGGDGDGFKLGGKTAPATNNILRTIKNSVAFKNRGAGITPEPDDADLILGVAIYNCTAYGNAVNWGEGINTGDYNSYTIVRNCISYANVNSNVWMRIGSIHDHNNFDIPLTTSDADFLSVNSVGMDGPRQADGSLPIVDFLKLAPSSDFIDAGVDVGLPFNGKAPDLGAFESGTSTSSTSIENLGGDIFVYPNPVNNILIISSKDDVKEMSLKLYDLNGTVLYGSTVTGNYKLDISRFQSGIYFLEVIIEGKTEIKKITKI